MALLNKSNFGRNQDQIAASRVYVDEVDIHLNPKIGADWQLRGQQKRVVTPGKNEKYYLAGALYSGTGKVSYIGSSCKNRGYISAC